MIKFSFQANIINNSVIISIFAIEINSSFLESIIRLFQFEHKNTKQNQKEAYQIWPYFRIMC